MIIEKQNTINLQRPAVVIDTFFEPKPKAPLPSKNGFALAIVGSPGSGKSSVMVSLIKSKDGYRKRFHKIISVIPQSSLASLKSNPLKDIPEEQQFEDLTFENLEDIVEMVEENREDGLLTLLLLDDVSAELQDPLILKAMMRLFLNRRHLKLSIIAIAHSLTGKGALPYTVRKNLSHLILFKPSASLDILNRDFLHMPKVKFKELTDYVYKGSHDHLMIELNTNKLYKNFNALTLK